MATDQQDTKVAGADQGKGLKPRGDGPWLWPIAIIVAVITFLTYVGLRERGESAATSLIIWFVLAGVSVLLWVMLARLARPKDKESSIRMIEPQEQPDAVKQVMDVRVATDEGGVQLYRGRLRQEPAAAYDQLRYHAGEGKLTLLQQDPQLGAAIVVAPDNHLHQPHKPTRWWLHILLLVLTLGTTTIAGAMLSGVNIFAEPHLIPVGFNYSIPLLLILGGHEMGHYVAGRLYKMDVTPPFFIPVPFWLGTFGAFIQMRSPSETRKILFDTGIAGPLAGLVIALPVLLWGLTTSDVVERRPLFEGLLSPSVGSSFLFSLAAKLSMGGDIAYGDHVQLSPMAFAGWLGMLITAINLLPIGQLDGGHVAQAMVGFRAGSVVSTLTMMGLLLLAWFVYPSLLLFALVVFFFIRSGAPPLNDLTPVGPRRFALGLASFIILVMILAPMPRELWASLG